mmetsp:Transcript_71428/g.118705  ORF Transcript_71428/g.118705 Transcript_71428/m.118705 type:complete len:153 (-) Transcript_71428:116-574(-)
MQIDKSRPRNSSMTHSVVCTPYMPDETQVSGSSCAQSCATYSMSSMRMHVQQHEHIPPQNRVQRRSKDDRCDKHPSRAVGRPLHDSNVMPLIKWKSCKEQRRGSARLLHQTRQSLPQSSEYRGRNKRAGLKALSSVNVAQRKAAMQSFMHVN